MAKPPLQTAAILLLLLVAAALWLQTADAASGFCSGKCSVRCGRARGACMRSCGLCCEECNCVPTGPARGGNECPCYRDMLTAGPRKRPKCP
ncbi:peamaclein-like [Miscanthus floridulus]|uniref:peamaclein-like n=1 Tax=Miscanthus floridulus TaxID=154761 RepID=UPI0034582697